jgi:hypothetical protein
MLPCLVLLLFLLQLLMLLLRGSQLAVKAAVRGAVLHDCKQLQALLIIHMQAIQSLQHSEMWPLLLKYYGTLMGV